VLVDSEQRFQQEMEFDVDDWIKQLVATWTGWTVGRDAD
jgi:hypothetical protein